MAAVFASFIIGVLLRDLETLHREVLAYPDDASLWLEPDGLPNAGGTLAIHLAGNMRHFVGTVLGGSGYTRDRDEEFSARGLSRAVVAQRVRATIDEVRATGTRLSDDVLHAPYPVSLRGVRVTTGDFLLHLIAHTAYHLGQIDYHRRGFTSSHDGVGAMAITELASVQRTG